MRADSLPWCIVTWNVLGAARPDIDALGAVLEASSPDVVCLQEVRRSQADELARCLSMRHTWAFKHHPTRPLFPGTAEGMAILTPHTLDHVGHAELSSGVSKRSWKRRIGQWALISRDDASAYRVYNVHLSPHGLADERRAEAERLAIIAASHGDSPPLVVAGDMNDVAESATTSALPGVEHLPPPPTVPSAAPNRAIDHVLLPADARNVSVDVPSGGSDWAELSDHLPVTARFSMTWVQGDWAATAATSPAPE